jgi:prepilin-type N-terminal cleavage/methylation domain-containing protein
MRTRRGFTLIEVLVSVVLIAVVILGIFKIREQSASSVSYLENRMGEELSGSLFVSDRVMNVGSDQIPALYMLKDMGVSNEKVRDVLRHIKRRIALAPPSSADEVSLPVQIQPVVIKGEYSSRYYRIASGQAKDEIPGNSPETKENGEGK